MEVGFRISRICTTCHGAGKRKNIVEYLSHPFFFSFFLTNITVRVPSSQNNSADMGGEQTKKSAQGLENRLGGESGRAPVQDR